MTPFQGWEMVPAALVLSGWALQLAVLDPRRWDLALAYHGGVEAWQSGHPEWVRSWMGTPVLAAVMAIVARLLDEDTAARGLTVLNVALVAALVAFTWGSLRRGHLGRGFWWITLALAAFFAPLLSCLYYRQINIVAFALAAAGFAAVRKGRAAVGGALLGASVSLKPLVLLLPIVMLARKDSRRGGLVSLAAVAVLTLGAQAFLATRAHDASALSPLPALENFSAKAERWIYSQENFAPRGMLCRMATTREEGAITRTFGLLAGLLLVLGAGHAVGKAAGTSWGFFAFACLLSPLTAPIAWAHYQILMLPMLLLLAFEFRALGARWSDWAALAVSYGLADLLLRPLDDSVLGGLVYLATGRREGLADILQVMALSQLGQYALYAAAVRWFYRRRRLAAGPTLC